jgi:protein-disulfide isomerase
MSTKMKITLFSFSCCDPRQGVYDQQYIEKIKESLDQTAVEAQIDSVAATDALYGFNTEYIEQLRPLFKKYGMSVAPVLFINDELVLYGTVPPIEKLVEVIEESVKKSGA